MCGNTESSQIRSTSAKALSLVDDTSATVLTSAQIRQTRLEALQLGERSVLASIRSSLLSHAFVDTLEQGRTRSSRGGCLILAQVAHTQQAPFAQALLIDIVHKRASVRRGKAGGQLTAKALLALRVGCIAQSVLSPQRQHARGRALAKLQILPAIEATRVARATFNVAQQAVATGRRVRVQTANKNEQSPSPQLDALKGRARDFEALCRVRGVGATVTHFSEVVHLIARSNVRLLVQVANATLSRRCGLLFTGSELRGQVDPNSTEGKEKCVTPSSSS